jgi:dienelactone hydrolase
MLGKKNFLGLLGIVLIAACSPKTEPDENPAFKLSRGSIKAIMTTKSEKDFELQIWQPTHENYGSTIGYYQNVIYGKSVDSIAQTFGALKSGFEMFARRPKEIFISGEPIAAPKAILVFYPAWARLNTGLYNIWFKLLTEEGYSIIAINLPHYHEGVKTLMGEPIAFNKTLLQNTKLGSGPILQQIAELEDFEERQKLFEKLGDTPVIKNLENWKEITKNLVDSIANNSESPVFLMGHAFGGAVAMSLAEDVPNISGVINLDGMFLTKPSQKLNKMPILHFNTGEDAGFNREIKEKYNLNYKEINFIKTRQYAFTDFIFWPEEKFVRGAKVAITGRAKPGKFYNTVSSKISEFIEENGIRNAH